MEEISTTSELWKIFEDNISVPPSPISNWYICGREGFLEEDAVFQNRLPRVTKEKEIAALSVGECTVTRVILRYNEVDEFYFVKEEFPKYYLAVTNVVRKMGVSVLISVSAPFLSMQDVRASSMDHMYLKSFISKWKRKWLLKYLKILSYMFSTMVFKYSNMEILS